MRGIFRGEALIFLPAITPICQDVFVAGTGHMELKWSQMNKLRKINSSTLVLNKDDEKFYYRKSPYTGLVEYVKDDQLVTVYQMVDGIMKGICRDYDDKGNISKIGMYNDIRHGYFLEFFPYGESFVVFDLENILEIIDVNRSGERLSYYNILEQSNAQSMDDWKSSREELAREGYYEGDYDILPYYQLQNELSNKVVEKNELPKEIKFIAGVDVAYNEVEQRMVGAIVVLDANTLEEVDQSWHEMEITFPYIPGLFSFREVPPILEAYKKLKLEPDLIICDELQTVLPADLCHALNRYGHSHLLQVYRHQPQSRHHQYRVFFPKDCIEICQQTE